MLFARFILWNLTVLVVYVAAKSIDANVDPKIVQEKADPLRNLKEQDNVGPKSEASEIDEPVPDTPDASETSGPVPDALKISRLKPKPPQCGFGQTMAWAECTPVLSKPCPTECSTPDNCQFPYCNASKRCQCEKVWCRNDFMCHFFRIPCDGTFTCKNNSCICEPSTSESADTD